MLFLVSDVAGYIPIEADAGFETNPLVISNVIYAGNRDGYFYALDAVTGDLKWKYKTGGPIQFSAAYKDEEIYFASNDAHAYALKTDGNLIWKSQKLAGAGFRSFWPVVYSEKTTGKDYVIFSGSENYRLSDAPGFNTLDEDYFFPGCHNIPGYTCPPGGTLIGASGTDSGPNTYWGHNAVTIDANTIANYYEKYPDRRTVYVLDRTNGQEYRL